MNIAFEARALSAGSSGVKHYTSELLQALSTESEDTLNVLTDRDIDVAAAANVHAIPLASPVLLPFWLQYQLPRALQRIQPDVVHYTKADVPSRKEFPTVVTIYDVIPLFLPQTQSPLRRLYWPRALARAAQRSDRIITISETSKRDIIKHFNVPSENITVTTLPINRDHFSPRTARPHPNPYILFVGTRDQRKNIGGLLRAFALIKDKIPHDLVIVGRPAFKDDGSQEESQRLNLGDRVSFLENVSYEELPDYYSAASVFVWPSIYEGWSFPAMEAMACGTPVIVSDGGPLPEVVGDAGEIIPFTEQDVQKRFSDTSFEYDLGERIVALLDDEERQAQLRAAGLARVQATSWQDVARKTREVYESVV